MLAHDDWPAAIETVEQLDELLSRPGQSGVEGLRRADGDVIVLGAAGKMGPTLVRMLRRAAEEISPGRRIIAVSRFRDPELRQQFTGWGVETIVGDLSDRRFVAELPDAPNIFFLSGMKFGATGNEPLTWGMNAYVPAVVAERYAGRRIVAFSTGNVYGLTAVARGGSQELDPLAPVGEYAMSCVGRERLFQYFSERDGTATTIIRLNYAVELRYGVLLDLAERIRRGAAIDLSMGHVNVIWQGDACRAVIAALADSSSPARVLNVAGADVLSVRSLAERMAEGLGRPAQFTGTEGADALLNDAAVCHAAYGRPEVRVDQMLAWTVAWVQGGGVSFGKPTHFESRTGRF